MAHTHCLVRTDPSGAEFWTQKEKEIPRRDNPGFLCGRMTANYPGFRS